METNEENKQATDADSTSEENQEEEKSEEESSEETKEESKEESEEETKESSEEKTSDINYGEELTKLKSNEATVTKPSERSEEEKARFTMDKIVERFPHFKEDVTVEKTNDEAVDKMHRSLLRNQVEGIIRANSKSDEEVKYKLYFYDKRIQQTGNIHEDADNAEWLANKTRTRNAIKEMKRDPGDPGSGSGAGQKSASNEAPELPAVEHQRLIQAGLKKTAPGKYEGTKTVIEWDPKERQWNQTMKS